MSQVKETPRVERVRARARRAAFEALYGPFAWAYDWVSRTFFLGQWQQWQRASLPYLRGPRVLEVGMGTGKFQLYLAQTGFSTYGVDLSPQMLRLAVKRARKHRGAGESIRVCRCRAQSLPFAGGVFSSVVSTFPSDYIGAPETLHEIYRVLEPDGRLVIVPAGWLAPGGAKAALFDWVARLVYGGANVKPPPTRAQQAGESASFKSVWVGTLEARMRDAGFDTEQHIAKSSRGAALVIAGTKRAARNGPD